jgi:hypothetical protein
MWWSLRSGSLKYRTDVGGAAVELVGLYAVPTNGKGKNDEIQMTNDESMPQRPNVEARSLIIRHSDLVIFSSLGLRHSSLPPGQGSNQT